jgi:predicted TIM-barrel fold metal-dependent hydrolase
MIDDYLRDITDSGHNVVSSVFITCATSYRQDGPELYKVLGETEFANGAGAIGASGALGARRLVAGIVGAAYLRAGEAIADVLDAQAAVSGGRLCGIRETHWWDAGLPPHRTQPPAHMAFDPAFREGFKQLALRNLAYDVLCYHSQLDDVIDLARSFPDTTIVLDHFGCPLGIGPYVGRPDEVFAVTKKGLAELARYPNVMVKLGGIQMPINGMKWEQDASPPGSDALVARTRHYYETAIALFGVTRCMFESNFPVDKLSCSYGIIWNAFKKITAGYSLAEKRALFYGNATRIYGLPDVAPAV